MEPTDIRLRQLSRMLGRPLDAAAAAAVIGAEVEAFADAIFEEATDSDDVTDLESATEFLDERLAFFGDYLAAGVEPQVRTRFASRWDDWEQL